MLKTEAAIIFEALSTGDWSINRTHASAGLEHEGHSAPVWRVKRESPPFVAAFGACAWEGDTALAALQAAITDLGLAPLQSDEHEGSMSPQVPSMVVHALAVDVSNAIQSDASSLEELYQGKFGVEFGKVLRGIAQRQWDLSRSESASNNVALSREECLQLMQAVEDYRDTGETDVPIETLLRGALAGYLGCERFHVVDLKKLQSDCDTLLESDSDYSPLLEKLFELPDGQYKMRSGYPFASDSVLRDRRGWVNVERKMGQDTWVTWQQSRHSGFNLVKRFAERFFKYRGYEPSFTFVVSPSGRNLLRLVELPNFSGDERGLLKSGYNIQSDIRWLSWQLFEPRSHE